MKLLFRSLEAFYLGGQYSDKPVYLRVETDGETLFVTLGYQSNLAQAYSGEISVNVTYNGMTKTIGGNPFGEKRSVSFPYDDSVKTVRVDGVTFYYKDTTYTDGRDFTWRTSFDSVVPEVTFTCPGPRYTSRHPVSWSIVDPLGRPTACAGLLEHFYRQTNGWWETYNVFTLKYTATSTSNYVSSNFEVGDLMYYTFYAGVYETADAAREDYVELVEVISPLYVVSNEYAPYAPFDVQCKTPVVRSPSKVTWQYINDSSYPASKGFELERSVNGGDFALIYAGTSTSFSDTIPIGAETVQYRVRAVGQSQRSVYSTGEVLDTVLSNIYVGVNGEIRLAAGLYIGENGAVRQVTPLVEVGA